MLRHQIEAFTGKAIAAGVRVDLTVAADMIHVFQLLAVSADRRQCPQPHLSVARITSFITGLMTPLAAAAPTVTAFGLSAEVAGY